MNALTEPKTAETTTVSEAEALSAGQEPRLPAFLRASRDEIRAFAGVGTIAAAWIASVLLFGFAGLIVGALAMVIVGFALVIVISRG